LIIADNAYILASMTTQHFIKQPFIKMHGLGNDFMMLDARTAPLSLPEPFSHSLPPLAHRHTGVGFDQAIILRTSTHADVFMQIVNSDGSEVAACGNATRCVAWHLMQETNAQHVTIETKAAILSADYVSHQRVAVTMGVPRLTWQEIPLSSAMDTLHVQHGYPALPEGVAVNMGNPHMIIFHDAIHTLDLARIGSTLEMSPLFPERANITLAQIIHPTHITIRTWERGVGITQACGTAACASMVAGRRLGMLEAEVTVTMLGGDVVIAWEGTESSPDYPLTMTGDAAYVYRGKIDNYTL
jgi:diaminopimelate epimerase